MSVILCFLLRLLYPDLLDAYEIVFTNTDAVKHHGVLVELQRRSFGDETIRFEIVCQKDYFQGKDYIFIKKDEDGKYLKLV